MNDPQFVTCAGSDHMHALPDHAKHIDPLLVCPADDGDAKFCQPVACALQEFSGVRDVGMVAPPDPVNRYQPAAKVLSQVDPADPLTETFLSG